MPRAWRPMACASSTSCAGEAVPSERSVCVCRSIMDVWKGFHRVVGHGALADAGVQAAEAGGRMARMGDHADDDFLVIALVPFEGDNVAQRQHQLELESHHVMRSEEHTSELQSPMYLV